MEDYSRIHISLIGFGNVGRCVFNLLLQDRNRRFCINIIDPSPELSGSVLDLGQSAMLYDRHQVEWQNYLLCEKADFIIYSAGEPVPKGMCRDVKLPENRAIVKAVFSQFRPKKSAIIITLTNPLDVIALDVLMASKLPQDNVIGVGTIIESVRLKYYLSKISGVDASLIQAMVLGEHGETMVPMLSLTYIDHKLVKNALADHIIRDCIYETRRTPHRIKETQGASYFTAANATISILHSLLIQQSEIIPLSIYHEKENIFYSVPVRITPQGFEAIVMSIDTDELEALEESKAKIASLRDDVLVQT